MSPMLAIASAAAIVVPTTLAAMHENPSVEVPAAFRDAGLGSWKAGDTRAAHLNEAWWTAYGDADLERLLMLALANNPDLRAAAARVEQARAIAGVARADYFPSLQLDASATRGRNAANAPPTGNLISIPAILSYEVDLWGRVRRSHEAARADAFAQDHLFAAARLSLAADVGQTYFALLASRRDETIVTATVATRRDALDVISARLQSGSATELDVARAEAELATAEAELARAQQRSAALQNGLAVLTGAAAPDFVPALPASDVRNPLPTPPEVPAGLPSALLERRPDIAAAEAALAAAHARIGVARAAFFPSISLTGTAGYESGEFAGLFGWDQRAWSLGPRVTLPIFQGGGNVSNLRRARAAYAETVADYRGRILVAFRETQDALTASRLLATQAAAQERAAASARRAAQLSRTRYDAGFVSYLEVVDSERSALVAERAAAQLSAQRLITSIALIRALGGGWEPAHEAHR